MDVLVKGMPLVFQILWYYMLLQWPLLGTRMEMVLAAIGVVDGQMRLLLND